MVRAFYFLETVWHDLRYAVRMLRKNPVFACVAIGTFALAIGANAAIFSVLNAAFLQPLPYPEPNRLAFLWEGPNNVTYSFSHPRYEMLRDSASDFEGIAAYDDESITAAVSGEPERIEGGRVSANFFSVIGVAPVIGRTFTPEEDRFRGPPLVILSHEYWESRFNSDPNILGRSMRIDGTTQTIVGVLPAGFRFLGENVDVWRSRLADSGTFFPSTVRRGAQFLTVIGRLKPGVGIRQAQASLDVLGIRYQQDYPGNDDIDVSVHIAPLQEQLVSGLRLNLFLTWGAVSCLLLIACANIANLLLARASARIKEVAVRLAIGATRERIARQLLTEGVLISVCGGALGLLVAQWGARVLAATIHQSSHQAPEARIDATVVAFTLVVSVIVGLGFGLVPSIAALRKDIRRPRVHPQNILVTAEIALSLVLLVSAGLLMQSFLRMRGMATGIRSDQVSILWLILNPHRYENFPERAAFYDETLRRVRALPGVCSAAIASRVDVMQPGDVGVDTVIPRSEPQASSRGRSISPDYLSLMGIPLLAGRDFTEHDSTSSSKVMLVNHSFARRFFPDQDPVGKHVTVSSSAWEIVGVTGDVRLSLQSAGASEEFYLPLAQAPRGTARLLIRSTAPLSAVRHEVQAIDPDQAVAQMRPLNDALDDSLSQPRSMMSIFSIFAAAALLLAAMGVYGVMACGVAQRTREIGIRIALGARVGDVRRMVIRQSMRLVLTGVALGIPIAIAVGRLYSSLLFGVKSGDPVTLIAVVAILSIAALAAAYIPSRRATKVDPASVLRAQ